jgi:hypothetical protein
MQPSTSRTLPRTPEEALEIVKEVSIPTGTLIAWINAVAPIPAGYAGELFVSMQQCLGEAIQTAAKECLDQTTAARS